MGIFDGPLFDFNGDGKTDAFEFAMAMSIIEDIEQEEREQEKGSLRAGVGEGDSLARSEPFSYS